jgi:hypothetical protein
MMEAAGTSEGPVNFHQTTRHNHPEDGRLHQVYSLGHFTMMYQLMKLRTIEWDMIRSLQIKNEERCGLGRT